MVRALLRGVYRGLSAPWDKLRLRDLAKAEHPDGRRIARVLESLSHPLPRTEQEAIDAIERARTELCVRTDPLVDGTLSESGLYDGDLTVGDACAASKGPRPALALYAFVKEFQPQSVLELGTNLGISTAYLATALRLVGRGGRITTLEASPYRLRLAREMHSRLNLHDIEYCRGLFADTLHSTLDSISPVDFVFIDGHHQYESTLAYFDTIRERSNPGAIFVFDDIRWSRGMRQAWGRLRRDDRFDLTADLGEMGVGVNRAGQGGAVFHGRRMYTVLHGR